MKSRAIPVLLLKTRSQPADTYEENFSQVPSEPEISVAAYRFTPHFVPVLEHTQNGQALSELTALLQSGELKRKYGGMIFTSQRAVEAWMDVVHRAENNDQASKLRHESATVNSDPFSDLEPLTTFPVYVVGPATECALATLVDESKRVSQSPFIKLNPSIWGAETGNGANLAAYILNHYNQLYREYWFTYFEAPRLPFIPLLGMSSENYGRKRLEKDDERLRKKPLCFLVGETRRDVIPKTLHAAKDRINVEEVEVYATQVMASFESDISLVSRDFNGTLREIPRVVVVFSPQGSEIMLKHIGYLDQQGKPTEMAIKRWWQGEQKLVDNLKWIVATIGPTTKDHLKNKLGVEPDVCAEKPNPEALKKGIVDFLKQNNIQP